MRKQVLMELPKFVSEIQKMVTNHIEKHSPILNQAAKEKGFKNGYNEISLDRISGRTKYARIVSTKRPGTARSVYCFVDLTNGNILKAASWKAPARHARGNIFDSDRLKAVSPYGANYLKANQNNNKEDNMSEKSLRSKIIRLAHAKPHLRSHLLPLVTNKVAKKEFKKGDSVTYKGKDCKIVEVAKNGKVTIKSKGKGGATKTFSAKDAEKMLK